LQKAYQHQMSGEVDLAVELYHRSIETFPTAEAHTFLGWAYSFQGKLKEAIAECRTAIDLDPDFGNPYNDIGSYLIELGSYDEAIPWLEQAILAPRYHAYHLPHHNLGRAYRKKGWFGAALRQFERALEIFPEFAPSREAIARVKLKIH
jgi:Tfp pilus assembly protein PilF